MINDRFPDTSRFPRAVRSLHSEVVEEIARWMIAGHFREGDVLPNEQEIGDQLGVSRTVVREAVRTLVAKGMLQVRRRTGTVVLGEDEWSIFDTEVLAWRFRHGVSDAFLEDLFRFRAGMETFAAEFDALLSPDVLIEENMRRTLPRHRAVVDAIASGSSERAREAMLLLVGEARDDTLKRIGEAGEQA